MRAKNLMQLRVKLQATYRAVIALVFVLFLSFALIFFLIFFFGVCLNRDMEPLNMTRKDNCTANVGIFHTYIYLYSNIYIV